VKAPRIPEEREKRRVSSSKHPRAGGLLSVMQLDQPAQVPSSFWARMTIGQGPETGTVTVYRGKKSYRGGIRCGKGRI
jgi:hypothetical protein